MAFPRGGNNWSQSQNSNLSLQNAGTYGTGMPPVDVESSRFMIAVPQGANNYPPSNINSPAPPGWKPQSIPHLPLPHLSSLDRVRDTQQTSQKFHHSAYQNLQQPVPLPSLSDRFINVTDHYPGPICPSVSYSRQLMSTTPGHPAVPAFNRGPEYPSLPGFYVPPNNCSIVPRALTFDQRPQTQRVTYNTSHSNGSFQGYSPSVLSRNSFPTVTRPVQGAMDLSEPANSQNAGIGALSSSRPDSAPPLAHPAPEPSPIPPIPHTQWEPTIDPIIVGPTSHKGVKSNTSAEVGTGIRNGNVDGNDGGPDQEAFYDTIVVRSPAQMPTLSTAPIRSGNVDGNDCGPDQEGFYDTIVVRSPAQMPTLSTAPIRSGNFDGNDCGPDQEGFYDTIVVRSPAQMRTLSTAPIRNGNFDGNDCGPDQEGFYDTIVVRSPGQTRTLSTAPAPGKGMGERTGTNESNMWGTEVDTDVDMEEAQPERMTVNANKGRRARRTIEDSEDDEEPKDDQEDE
ncbi:hypothetical protein L211DRAFT_869231 [Terfezia boudieri ATCC MYA-4762]|uniref:Uncharacterized protein n=1 Tax=Terfezia boudieri ATCC MYA-4762 TaxID=1051890 RepID=A0A3N4LWN6_9PEZI|nr:hypothetical protein L211DRAFT_869231 [Terfezia boudieri ATCC MYA-4762]